MRNWNWTLVYHTPAKFIKLLYLTYEELKRLAHVSSCYDSCSVVPYLWGIETSYVKSFTGIDKANCCTLPMRNWNIIEILDISCPFLTLYLTYEELKHSSALRSVPGQQLRCTLPMRNWNFSTSQVYYSSALLYLTYEELKPLHHIVSNNGLLMLYLTYEELKPVALTLFCAMVIVVPYLWGIETYYSHE